MDNTQVENIIQNIHQLYEKLQTEMRDKYNRDLPLDELLFDRWEHARRLNFGKNTSIYHNSFIFGDVKIGENTWVGPYTVLDGSGGEVTIGSYCSVGSGTHIYTHDSARWAVSGGKAAYEHGPVKIGSCVFIGPQVIITRGVTIGDHSLISANTFVNRDIQPYSIVTGSPGRVIGKVLIEGDDVKFVYSGSHASPRKTLPSS
jgi:acetyltransferase-like isoleucine patch superfamily enzyme